MKTKETEKQKLRREAEEQINRICEVVRQNFRTFGGGEVNIPNNPIAAALKDHSLCFAAGVDVKQVAITIIDEWNKFLVERRGK